jgi:hypothetical protein
VATEIDRALLEKTIELTGMALRGAMGGEGSKEASYAAELFREVWAAVKEGAKDIPDRAKAGF